MELDIECCFGNIDGTSSCLDKACAFQHDLVTGYHRVDLDNDAPRPTLKTWQMMLLDQSLCPEFHDSTQGDTGQGTGKDPLLRLSRLKYWTADISGPLPAVSDRD